MQTKLKVQKIAAAPKKIPNPRTNVSRTSAPRIQQDVNREFNQEEVMAEIKRILKRDLQWDQPVRPDHRLLEDLQLDSLGLLTLALGLENGFRIHLLGEDSIELRTVDDLAGYVLERIRQREIGKRNP